MVECWYWVEDFFSARFSVNVSIYIFLFQTFSRNDLPGEAPLSRGRSVFKKKREEKKKKKKKKREKILSFERCAEV